jgi:hypothetical protein
MEDPETAKSVRNTSWPGLVPGPERSNAYSALSRCAALSILMGYPTCLHVTRHVSILQTSFTDSVEKC